MNRLIIAAAVLFVFAAAFVVFKPGLDSSDTLSSGNSNSAKTEANEPHHTVEITAANFEELVLNSDKPVLLDFWAPWCGPCVMLGPHIEKIAVDYDGVAVIGKVNVDQQQELASRFTITGIPALVYLKGGEVVERSVGFQQPEAMVEVLDNLIEQ